MSPMLKKGKLPMQLSAHVYPHFDGSLIEVQYFSFSKVSIVCPKTAPEIISANHPSIDHTLTSPDIYFVSVFRFLGTYKCAR